MDAHIAVEAAITAAHARGDQDYVAELRSALAARDWAALKDVGVINRAQYDAAMGIRRVPAMRGGDPAFAANIGRSPEYTKMAQRAVDGLNLGEGRHAGHVFIARHADGYSILGEGVPTRSGLDADEAIDFIVAALLQHERRRPNSTGRPAAGSFQHPTGPERAEWRRAAQALRSRGSIEQAALLERAASKGFMTTAEFDRAGEAYRNWLVFNEPRGQHTANSPERHEKAKRWMRSHVSEFVDPQTGEVNCTRLAEEAANEVGENHWLDESTHPVWDWAVEIGEVEKDPYGYLHRGDPTRDIEPNARRGGRSMDVRRLAAAIADGVQERSGFAHADPVAMGAFRYSQPNDAVYVTIYADMLGDVHVVVALFTDGTFAVSAFTGKRPSDPTWGFSELDRLDLALQAIYHDTSKRNVEEAAKDLADDLVKFEERAAQEAPDED